MVFGLSIVLYHLYSSSDDNSSKMAMAWVDCCRHEEKGVDGSEQCCCAQFQDTRQTNQGTPSRRYARDRVSLINAGAVRAITQSLGLKDQEQN